MTKSVRIVQEFSAIEDEAQSWTHRTSRCITPGLRRASPLLPVTEDCIVNNLTSWAACLPETFRIDAAAERPPKRLKKPQTARFDRLKQVQAVQHWRYEPTVLNPQAVPVVLTAGANFSLAGAGKER